MAGCAGALGQAWFALLLTLALLVAALLCKAGGIPGTVRFGLEAVAPDGCQALAQQLLQAGEKSGQKEHELLATHLQTTMQAQYDRLRQADDGGSCGCCRRQSGPPASGSLESLLSPPNSPPGSPVS